MRIDRLFLFGLIVLGLSSCNQKPAKNKADDHVKYYRTYSIQRNTLGY